MTLKRKRDNLCETPSPELGTAQPVLVMTHLAAVGSLVSGDYTVMTVGEQMLGKQLPYARCLPVTGT